MSAPAVSSARAGRGCKPSVFCLRRGPQGRGEISIISHRQKKVNRHFAQTFNSLNPEICTIFQLEDWLSIAYNYTCQEESNRKEINYDTQRMD
jgi:hypothetical protein